METATVTTWYLTNMLKIYKTLTQKPINIYIYIIKVTFCSFLLRLSDTNRKTGDILEHLAVKRALQLQHYPRLRRKIPPSLLLDSEMFPFSLLNHQTFPPTSMFSSNLVQPPTGTTGACWTPASTRWSFGPRDTFRPCVAAASAWSLIRQSATSPSPKRPYRGWRSSGPKERRSRGTSSCGSALSGWGSSVPAPRPSTAAERARRGERAPHEGRRGIGEDEGLRKTLKWHGFLVDK